MKAYIDTTNKGLWDNAHIKSKIPIDRDNEEMFDKLKVGIVFGKFINLANKYALDEDDLKNGDELCEDDKNNNLDKVVNGDEDLGVPLSQVIISNGKKKKVIRNFKRYTC